MAKGPLIKPRGESPMDTVKRPLPSLPDEYDAMRAMARLDRGMLDRCAEEQPELRAAVGEKHVRACSLRDDASLALKQAVARLSNAYRGECREKSEKATDKSTEDYVNVHPEFLEAARRHSQLKYEADLWWSLREAFDDRSRMLHELTSQYASDYFGASGSYGPKNAVRDALAATAKEKLDEKRKARNG